ncbi:MAG: hypothetical protein ACYTFY_05730 [Planctomycetota bacterium]|jgi:hypothetical protein
MRKKFNLAEMRREIAEDKRQKTKDTSIISQDAIQEMLKKKRRNK